MENHELLTELIRAEQEYGIVATLHHYYGANIKIRMGCTKAICDAPIEDMMLSVRSWNALKRSNISTLGQLIDLCSQNGLYQIRNLGKKSISEIKTKMLAFAFNQSSERAKRQVFEYIVENNMPQQF